MANLFVDTPTVAQQMLDDFKTITQVQLSLKQIDDSNVIKALTYAGPISALYSQLQRLSNDTFAQSASQIALQNMLRARSLPPQGQPTKSNIQLSFTATGAATLTSGVTQAQRVSDGALFTCIQTVSVGSAGSIVAYFESNNTGNTQNTDLLDQPFTLSTATPNVDASGENTTLGLDGTDLESNESMASRVEAHDQNANSGGNAEAYIEWAKAASSEVVEATVLRLPRGPDTVDVVITSGTTDIAGAVMAGQPVVRLPSDSLIAIVLAYIEGLNPITDDVEVYGPTEIDFDVTFNFTCYDDSTANRTYVQGIILQQIQIYLYSANPQDVLTPTAIERLVDQAIGDQILQRECEPLGESTKEYVVPNANILVPGTITFGELE